MVLCETEKDSWLKCQWWRWGQGETILITECMEFLKSWLICLSCGLGNSIMPTLQRHSWRTGLAMQVRMWSGWTKDLGASFLNFSIWKWERESAISLHTPETWVTHTLISHLLAQKYNKRTKPIVWGAQVEPVPNLHNSLVFTMKQNLLAEPQVWTTRTIAFISFQVISTSFCDGDQCAQTFWKFQKTCILWVCSSNDRLLLTIILANKFITCTTMWVLIWVFTNTKVWDKIIV